MYQSKEKIQTVVLLLADLICFVISYFGGGYLWLVLYRNVSVQNMKSELMDSFGIVLVIYMLILLFSDLEKNFIRQPAVLHYGTGAAYGTTKYLCQILEKLEILLGANTTSTGYQNLCIHDVRCILNSLHNV